MGMRNVVRYQGGGILLTRSLQDWNEESRDSPRSGLVVKRTQRNVSWFKAGRGHLCHIPGPCLSWGSPQTHTFSFPYLCSPFSDLPPVSPCFSSRNLEQSPCLTLVSGGKSERQAGSPPPGSEQKPALRRGGGRGTRDGRCSKTRTHRKPRMKG